MWLGLLYNLLFWWGQVNKVFQCKPLGLFLHRPPSRYIISTFRMCACVIVLQFVILSVLVNRCWEVERCLTFELYFALLLASTMILGVQFCKDDPRCIRLLYNSAERQSLNPVNLRISWSLLAPSPPLSCYPANLPYYPAHLPIWCCPPYQGIIGLQ